MDPIQFQNKYEASFVPTAKPPVNPLVPAGATTAQIIEINRAHRRQVKQYQLMNAVNATLRSQLLMAAGFDVFVEFKNVVTGYGRGGRLWSGQCQSNLTLPVDRV